jgi:hypothetical protein
VVPDEFGGAARSQLDVCVVCSIRYRRGHGSDVWILAGSRRPYDRLVCRWILRRTPLVGSALRGIRPQADLRRVGQLVECELGADCCIAALQCTPVCKLDVRWRPTLARFWRFDSWEACLPLRHSQTVEPCSLISGTATTGGKPCLFSAWHPLRDLPSDPSSLGKSARWRPLLSGIKPDGWADRYRYIHVAGVNWRWVYWILTIFAGFCFALVAFALPETYGPKILATKAKRLRKETGQQEWYAPCECF